MPKNILFFCVKENKKLNELKTAWQEIQYTLLNSEGIKMVIDAGTMLLNLLSKLLKSVENISDSFTFGNGGLISLMLFNAPTNLLSYLKTNYNFKELEKKWGLPTALAMVIGIVIGSGIFFKAVKVLSLTNGNMGQALLVIGIVGLICIICSSVFAILGKKYYKCNKSVIYACSLRSQASKMTDDR